uniref:Uncharacterized protein n=1 Tax=Anguilla anguilla TaxID=7936 RepID=A0A0E9UGY0_ANGAN
MCHRFDCTDCEQYLNMLVYLNVCYAGMMFTLNQLKLPG